MFYHKWFFLLTIQFNLKMESRKLTGCTDMKKMACVLIMAIFISMIFSSGVSAQDELEDETSGTHSAKYSNLNVPFYLSLVLLFCLWLPAKLLKMRS